MRLRSPESAIVSAVVFNALVIVALIPLALRGVAYRPASASALLHRNLLVYGVGGLVAPFVGIKLLDLVISLHPRPLGARTDRHEGPLRPVPLQPRRAARARRRHRCVLGVAYPLLVTGVAQVVAPWRAHGSLVTATGAHTTDPDEAVGSALLGQLVDDPALFQPRPSAAGDGYDPLATDGSNLGPESPELVAADRGAPGRGRRARGRRPSPTCRRTR